MKYTKTLLLLLSVTLMSCGGTWEVSSTTYQSGTCATSTYQYGSFGWGFYDCYGRPVGAGYYSNYGYYYGPRIFIAPRTKSRIRSTSPRGRSRVRNTSSAPRTQVQPPVRRTRGSSGTTPVRGRNNKGTKNKY